MTVEPQPAPSHGMEMAQLGGSGIRVSRLWLGAMTFGGVTAETEATRIVGLAREGGVNAIDTADVYTGGESERITGRLIAQDRSRWIVATKAGAAAGPDPNDRGLSRRHLIAACEDSLRRLGTDWIDVHYWHTEDHTTPLEESIATMGDLIRSGKIRYFALSNHRAWRMARVAELCRAMGVPPPVAVQPPYSAVTRGAEVEVIPCANHYGMGVVAYSPLARGVLTGKYRDGMGTDSRASRADKRMMETEFRPESIAVATRLAEHAEATGRTPTAFAISWALANRLVTGVIGGPRDLAQWRAYMDAASVPWSAADEALANALVPPGHASTPGYTDPAYPVLGRKATAVSA
jgi:aryl-alcohol dehydrogenase-like predicted oxidoreductase